MEKSYFLRCQPKYSIYNSIYNFWNFEFSLAGKSNTILIFFLTKKKKSFKFEIAKLESHIEGFYESFSITDVSAKKCNKIYSVSN